MWQQVSWEISWNTFTHQICLDDPRVNLLDGEKGFEDLDS
jgi:hypothetical protein